MQGRLDISFTELSSKQNEKLATEPLVLPQGQFIIKTSIVFITYKMYAIKGNLIYIYQQQCFVTCAFEIDMWV